MAIYDTNNVEREYLPLMRMELTFVEMGPNVEYEL